MILTGNEIKSHLGNEIVIEPYNENQLNPNSYNLRLANELLVYKNDVLDMKQDNPVERIVIPEDGYVLQPNRLYLGNTVEYTETSANPKPGDPIFVPMLSGRSSIGRLGINVHATAGFGDVGFCHSKGTKIRMADGSLKNVEDVVIGDLVMSSTSTPSTVVATTEGFDELYTVSQSGAMSYTVTGKHLLSVVSFDNSVHSQLNISVLNYLKLTESQKKYYRGYKRIIEYPEQSLPVDPYTMGKYLANDKNLVLDKNQYKDLMDLKIIEKKRIVSEYQYNTLENRRKLFAGMVDSIGTIIEDPYSIEMAFQNKQLFDDVVSLCCSLGYNVSQSLKESENTVYYVATIVGNFFGVPCKNHTLKQDSKNKLGMCSSLSITPAGPGEYYGFTLDGNKEYFLEDGTITHNCGRWTLELFVIQPTIIYPNSEICQIYYYHAIGDPTLYQGKYNHAQTVESSRLYREFAK